jgi:predicted TIM-barrel enzyme
MQPSSSPRERDTTISALDTLGMSRRLQEAGFSEAQAEAVTEIIRDARSADLATLASKVQIEKLEAIVAARLEILKRDMTARVGAMIIAATAILLAAKFFG